jgi:hypothetical protein
MAEKQPRRSAYLHIIHNTKDLITLASNFILLPSEPICADRLVALSVLPALKPL